MPIQQREQNPDVNSYDPDIDPGEDPTAGQDPNTSNEDVERERKDPVTPVPPDAGPTVPIEDPPATGDVPVGDVDDSPTRIM